MPEHSLLTWKLTCEIQGGNYNIPADHEQKLRKSFTKWSRDVPNDFMSGADAQQEINDAIAHLEQCEKNQEEIDHILF